jgi:hypothetical protein
LDNEDTTSTHIADSSLPDTYIPFVRSVDKPSSSLPKTMMVTEDSSVHVLDSVVLIH